MHGVRDAQHSRMKLTVSVGHSQRHLYPPPATALPRGRISSLVGDGVARGASRPQGGAQDGAVEQRVYRAYMKMRENQRVDGTVLRASVVPLHRAAASRARLAIVLRSWAPASRTGTVRTCSTSSRCCAALTVWWRRHDYCRTGDGEMVVAER